MRPRQNHKGEWTYVYTAPVDGKDYTLLNKGARFLQTGLLETCCVRGTSNLKATCEDQAVWDGRDDQRGEPTISLQQRLTVVAEARSEPASCKLARQLTWVGDG